MASRTTSNSHAVARFYVSYGWAVGLEETKATYKEALEAASPNFWEMAMLQPSYNFEHITSMFTSLHVWPIESPPVVLAASDQAPLVVVGEAMQRLQTDHAWIQAGVHPKLQVVLALRRRGRD